MNIELITSDATPRINIRGVLDHQSLKTNFFETAEGKELLNMKPSAVIIDFESSDRIDTAGLAWILNAVRDAKKQSIKIEFAQVPDALKELAKLSGAESLI